MESYCWHPRHKNPPPILTPIPDLHQIFPHLKLYQIRHATISLAISHIFRRNSTKSDLATPLGQVFSRCIAGFFDDDFDQDYLQAWSQMQQLITSQPSAQTKLSLGEMYLKAESLSAQRCQFFFMFCGKVVSGLGGNACFSQKKQRNVPDTSVLAEICPDCISIWIASYKQSHSKSFFH